jgi:hypothetical protein
MAALTTSQALDNLRGDRRMMSTCAGFSVPCRASPQVLVTHG